MPRPATIPIAVALWLTAACGGGDDAALEPEPPAVNADGDDAGDDTTEAAAVAADLSDVPEYLTMTLDGQLYATDFVLCMGVPPGGTIINASSTDPDDPTDLFLQLGEDEILEIDGAEIEVEVDAAFGDEFDVTVSESGDVTGTVVIRSIPELDGQRIEIQGRCG